MKKGTFPNLSLWIKININIKIAVTEQAKYVPSTLNVISYLIPQQPSVQFSCSVVSDSLWPHGLQHARLPCPLPSPGACSNSCPLSQWCHPTISSSFVPFSSCLQSFPASGSFPMSQFITLEKGMASYFSILALRTPWTVWKDNNPQR